MLHKKVMGIGCKIKFISLGFGLNLLTQASGFAYVAPKVPSQKSLKPLPQMAERVLRPTLTSASGKLKSLALPGVTKVQRDSLSGAVRILSGRIDFPTNGFAKVTEELLHDHAVAFIDSHPSVFGVNSTDLELVTAASYMGSSEQFLKFHIRRDGTPIQDASIDFRFKKGFLVQIVNRSFAEIATPDDTVAPQFDHQAALLADGATVSTKGFTYRVEEDAEERAYRLVKVQNFKLDYPNGEALSLQLATKNAKVFEFKDTHYHMRTSVKADVHPRWHNETLQSESLPFLKVQTDDGALYTDEFGGTSKTSADAPRIEGLVGKYVEITPVTGERISQGATDNNGEWLLDLKKRGDTSPWLDKMIAQSMVYYHTNLIIAKAKTYIEHSWLNSQLPANVNLARTCNAHWDGRSINLYSGSKDCGNTGTISDVIYHEWGHGLDAKTGGIADGAFSEGYGDILSLVMTKSPVLGIGFLLPGNDPVRNLEGDYIYPRDANTEVHKEGLIIGSTFWDLFQEFAAVEGEDFAQDLLANFAFKMIFTAERYTDVYDALLVIDDDDGDLGNGTPNLCRINKIFAKHGLATIDESCTLLPPQEIEIIDGDGDGVIEPGETIDLKFFAKNVTSTVLSDLLGEIKLEPSPGISLTKNTLSWGPIAPGSRQGSLDLASLEIGSEVACGQQFTLGVKLYTPAQSVQTQHVFTVGRDMSQPITYKALDLPQEIADLATVESVVKVDDQLWENQTSVQNAHLQFSLSHSYTGDLKVDLVSPNRTRVNVYMGNGHGVDLNFDEDISDLVRGLTGLGEWTLSVQDRSRPDEGMLESFNLVLSPKTFCL